MQPVVAPGTAAETSAEQLSLQFRQLNLLVGHRVVGESIDLLDYDLVVLPTHIAQGERARGCEVVKRPMAASFEIGDTVAKIFAPYHCRGLLQVEVRVITRVQMRIAKVAKASSAFYVRAPGSPCQRFDVGEGRC